MNTREKLYHSSQVSKEQNLKLRDRSSVSAEAKAQFDRALASQNKHTAQQVTQDVAQQVSKESFKEKTISGSYVGEGMPWLDIHAIDQELDSDQMDISRLGLPWTELDVSDDLDIEHTENTENIDFTQIPGFIPHQCLAFFEGRFVPSRAYSDAPVLFDISSDGHSCSARSLTDNTIMRALFDLDFGAHDFSKSMDDDFSLAELSEPFQVTSKETPLPEGFSSSVSVPFVPVSTSLVPIEVQAQSPQDISHIIMERIHYASMVIEQESVEKCQCLVQIKGLGPIHLSLMTQSDALMIEMRIQNPAVAAVLVREIPALLTNLCQSKTLAERYKKLHVRMKTPSNKDR